MDEQDFRRRQPHLARLFANSRRLGRLAHAYLLVGDPSAPLTDSALFLARSLFCQESLLACGNCENCRRFLNSGHPDFTLVDGRGGTIKKDSIKALSDKYALGTIEKTHVGVYVIFEAANMTEEAANSLLKFLEEPGTELYAILTTSNLEKVLPTIRSRALTVRLSSTPSAELCRSVEDSCSPEEAYALSLFTATAEETVKLSHDEDFKDGYQAAEVFLNDLVSSWDKASYTLLKEGIELLKTQAALTYFIGICSRVFSDAIAQDTASPFAALTRGLRRYGNRLVAAVDRLQTMSSQLGANMNLTLSLAALLETLKD